MAGFAPFGRDDQPLLDVKIVGGKRVEVAVDQYGRPLKADTTKSRIDDRSRFNRSLSEERNQKNFSSSPSPSVPPWIRGGTPPKKVLKPLEATHSTSRRSSGSSSRSSDVGITPSVPMALPPIARQPTPELHSKDANKQYSTLLEQLKVKLEGFDTAKLKDAYLHFTGVDSTFTGFVDVGQVKHVFLQCRIPIDGDHFDALTSKFMAARRPNWVNYEQMLKYINGIVRNEQKIEGKVPTLDFSSHSKKDNDQEITLKPNHVSPRRINDGSITGRQSKIIVNHAFQDRQNAQLLVEMERLLKQVNNINELMWTLKESLNDLDPNGNTIVSIQKLKSICLRHHLPFNGSLLDRILEKFDPRGSGRVDWTEFIGFVERAMPLNINTSNSLVSNYSRSEQSTRQNIIDTPPSKPSWETRQPLQALSKREQIIPKAAALQQEEMYDEHKRLLDEQLKDQSQQLSDLLNKQQRYLDKRQKTIPDTHFAEKLSKAPEEMTRLQNTPHNQEELEEKHRKLLEKQFTLIEQKRKINEEQEKLSKYVSDDPVEDLDDNPVKSFLRLAHALYLYDSTGSGFLEYDVIRRLTTNYNLVYRLGFPSDVIEEAIDVSGTGDGMVSVDRLLDELKKNLVALNT